MKNIVSWKVFFVLLFLGLLSVVCVFPYIVTAQGEVLAKTGKPLALIFVLQLIQTLVLFSFTIFFGLVLTKKIGFRLPLIEAIVEKGDYKKIFKDIFARSVLIGVVVAVAIYAIDALFTVWGATISTHQSYAPAWQKLLAAFYGGATEEILMRLFLMSFFIWIGMKLGKRSEPTKVNIVVSIFLSSIIFGLGHLPITASLTKLDSLIVSRAIVLNGIGGVVFGWLFWKRGLDSAMFAHFTTDIVLLTLLP
ncbi:CPBP family intramembrane metalloprotease, partial [Candidatus Falkowbacteria bacterium]|nr:CPBP family intramembrane metalloprotease [Candidatus Falkowbacteria bacterium]